MDEHQDLLHGPLLELDERYRIYETVDFGVAFGNLLIGNVSYAPNAPDTISISFNRALTSEDLGRLFRELRSKMIFVPPTPPTATKYFIRPTPEEAAQTERGFADSSWPHIPLPLDGDTVVMGPTPPTTPP